LTDHEKIPVPTENGETAHLQSCHATHRPVESRTPHQPFHGREVLAAQRGRLVLVGLLLCVLRLWAGKLARFAWR
jgi:hypothetical protein